MSEKINFVDLMQMNPDAGYMFITAISDSNGKLKIPVAKEYEVTLIVNGIEVSFLAMCKELLAVRTEFIAVKATELIKERIQKLVDRLFQLESSIDSKLWELFPEARRED
jgi:hypothetical protein